MENLSATCLNDSDYNLLNITESHRIILRNINIDGCDLSKETKEKRGKEDNTLEIKIWQSNSC